MKQVSKSLIPKVTEWKVNEGNPEVKLKMEDRTLNIFLLLYRPLSGVDNGNGVKFRKKLLNKCKMEMMAKVIMNIIIGIIFMCIIVKGKERE